MRSPFGLPPFPPPPSRILLSPALSVFRPSVISCRLYLSPPYPNSSLVLCLGYLDREGPASLIPPASSHSEEASCPAKTSSRRIPCSSRRIPCSSRRLKPRKSSA